MITEKQIQKYVETFGDRLINDIIQKIEANNWINTGNLLNTLEFTSQAFKDKIVGELNIAGYYQFLKDGSKKTKGTETKRISARTSMVTAKAYGQKLQVPENKVTFVTPLVKKEIDYFDKNLVPQIEKDVTKIIEDNLNKAIK